MSVCKIQTGGPIYYALFFLSLGEVHYLFAIEGHWNDETYGDLALEVVRRSDVPDLSLRKEWPSAMADSLSRGAEGIALDGGPDRVGFMYAGAFIDTSYAYVSTAGFVRVHLLSTEGLTQVTRDHNVLSDDFDTVGGKYRNLPADVAKTIPTRAIGAGFTYTLENMEWEWTPQSTLLICSSRVHLCGDPESYLSGVMEGAEVWSGFTIKVSA